MEKKKLYHILYIDSQDTNQNNSMKSKKGHLSSRMLIPGNTWQTVWESAKPLSARRQVI